MSPVGLRDETAAAEREAQAVSALKEAVAASGNPALWALAPKLAIATTGVDTAPGRTGAIAFATTVMRGRFRPGPRIVLIDGIAFVTTSAGQRKTLQPVIEALGGPAAAPSALPPVGAAEVRIALAGIRAPSRAVESWSRSHGLTLDEDPQSALLGAELTRARAVRWLLQARPRLLVVATQHNAVVRAILHAARQVGVPSAYVPHAPAADVPWYRDLPVDRALVRGPGECSFYGRIGARPGQLAVVGDPSVASPAEAVADVRADAPVVWATSPHPPETLQAVIAVIRESGVPVDVAPHPRADRDALRALCPERWAWISEPSTGARLLSRPLSGLVQHRSGMGLEAMLAGVPVHELCAPGRVPPYVYLQELGTPTISDAAELAASVAKPTDRDVTRSAARQWCAMTGPESSGAVIAQLSSMTAEGVPALDGWGTR